MAEQMVDTLRIPALYDGISRQPASRRFPTQVADAWNVLFDIATGPSKRPGSWFIREVCEPPTLANTNVRLHPIDRDGSEQYLVIYSGASGATSAMVRVVPIEGAAATVNISADAQEYLDTNDASTDEFRLITIADATLILNRTVELSTLATDDYVVTATHRDYDVMASNTPDQDTYHQTLADTATQPKGYFQYNTENLTFATVEFDPISGQWLDPRSGWVAASGGFGFKIAFRRVNLSDTVGNVAYTHATLKLTKVGAFAGLTASPGDQIRITAGTGATLGWVTLVQKDSDNQIEIATAIGAGDIADIEFDGIGHEYEVIKDFSGDNPLDMFDIAAGLQTTLQTDGASDGLIAWTEDTPTTGHFTVTSPYRGVDATIYPTSPPTGADPVTGPRDLTEYEYDGGKPFSNAGGEYTVTDGTGGTGTTTMPVDDRWTRVAAPGQDSGKLDPKTMPVKMTRTSTSPLVFDIDVIEWNDRTSGDEDTNPVPALWEKGKTLSDIAFYRGRLGLAGDEYVVFSVVNDLFNFFIEDASNRVDSDPIVMPLSVDEVTIIDAVVVFRNVLAVFTKAGQQFELSAPDIFTQDTTAFTASTAYQTFGVKPMPMGKFLYFLGNLGCSAQLREYGYDESSAASDAANAAAHIGDFLPETPRSMEVSANSNTIFILPEDSRDLYVYKSHWDGNQKVQSAWNRWVFEVTNRISDIARIGNDLYMLIEHDADTIDSMPETRLISGEGTPQSPSGSSSSSGSPSSSSSSSSSSSASGGGGGSGAWVIERVSIPQELADCPIPTVTAC